MKDSSFLTSSPEKKEDRSSKKRQDCKELTKIIDLISSKNPLQKKRIETFLKYQDEEYWMFAEELSRILNYRFLLSEKQRIKAANSYNRMCMDFLREQIRFRKTGVYRIADASVANKEVYSDIEVMRYYMVGLLLSYLFWSNHYQLFRFFKDNLPKRQLSNFLEVGVGHGLFTSTMLRQYSNIKGTLVDISATSILIAKEVLQTFQIDPSNLQFILGDYLKVSIPESDFDFIIMGEVLEHVNNAPLFMTRTKELLNPNGSIYLSTATNSPALDHVYHFHSIDEIRDLIYGSGFQIISELALPSENIPPERWEEELITINYCALIGHQKDNNAL